MTFSIRNFEIEIGGMDYGFTFMIIGMDFLTKAGAKIDLEHWKSNLPIQFRAEDSSHG